MSEKINYDELENVDDINMDELISPEKEYDPLEGEITERDVDAMIRGFKMQGLYY